VIEVVLLGSIPSGFAGVAFPRRELAYRLLSVCFDGSTPALGDSIDPFVTHQNSTGEILGRFFGPSHANAAGVSPLWTFATDVAAAGITFSVLTTYGVALPPDLWILPGEILLAGFAAGGSPLCTCTARIQTL